MFVNETPPHSPDAGQVLLVIQHHLKAARDTVVALELLLATVDALDDPTANQILGVINRRYLAAKGDVLKSLARLKIEADRLWDH